MPLDALTLAALREELAPLVLGAQVQKVVFPDERSVALALYVRGAGRRDLLLSAQPDAPAVQLLEAAPVRGVDSETPFHLLLRKHLRNAHVVALDQPPFERVLQFQVRRRDEDGRHYSGQLIVEAMGRRSNLLLVGEDGLIRDAVRRAPPSRNPVRPVLPHLPYQPPPPLHRLAPRQVTASLLADEGRRRGGTVADLLAGLVGWLSPTAAREIAFRATGAVDAVTHGADWGRVDEVLRAFLLPLLDASWRPTLVLRMGTPSDFAAYRPEHLRAASAAVDLLDRGSVVEAMRAMSGRSRVISAGGGGPLAGERRQLVTRVVELRERHARRLSALERQRADGLESAALRRCGELLLTHQYALHSITASPVMLEGEPVEVDVHLTAVQNAQVYFTRYREARDTATRLPALLEGARATIEHLETLGALAEVAEDAEALRALRGEIEQVARPIAPEPRARTSKRSAPSRGPAPKPRYRLVAIAPGWQAVVGQSATGNAAITFDLAGPDDLWLHARGRPGAHVILRGPRGREVPPAVLETAAALAAAHSSVRSEGSVQVDITERRHVRKIAGGPPGLVRYTNERTIRVRPAADT